VHFPADPVYGIVRLAMDYDSARDLEFPSTVFPPIFDHRLAVRPGLYGGVVKEQWNGYT
jgi:hypothetical protein